MTYPQKLTTFAALGPFRAASVLEHFPDGSSATGGWVSTGPGRESCACCGTRRLKSLYLLRWNIYPLEAALMGADKEG